MFFIGLIIIILALYLLGEAGIYVLAILLFALFFSLYFRVRKIDKDMLSIKLKLGIVDEETARYPEIVNEKASEQRQASFMSQQEEEKPIPKTAIDEEIETELRQHLEKEHTSTDETKKD